MTAAPEDRRRTQDRLLMISRAFTQAYFGHVSTCMAAWGELDLYCDNFFAASNADAGHLQEVFQKVLLEHPLNVYPVSEKLKHNVALWIKAMLKRNGATLLNPELNALCTDFAKLEPVQPEYIFKTFDRPSSFLTLLEENRDLISHGTTGLTSWQGAMFLADWADTFGHLLKVGWLRINIKAS